MANPTGGFKRGILTSPTPGRSNNNAASKASTVEGKRIVAAKIASAVGAGGAPTRVINAFIQVKDYPGLDRYLCKHKIPTDILTSSLQRACMTSDSEAVQIFAKNGANVNYVDQFGTTLLHFAMRGGGNERVIQYLITYGLEYNTWRSEGMPLLHWACSMGYTQLVEYMVGTKDAPLQEADDSGRLPIHVAAVYGQPSVLSYLIRALSKRLCAVSVPPQYLDAVETHGRTAIAEETEDDSVSSENVLKRPEKVPLVILRNRVRRPTYCQEPGNAQLAAASNYLDLHQWTPLHHASCEDAINNYQDCLKILLDNGADPMLQTLQGKTALDLAYAAGRSQMLVDVLPKRQLIALLMRIDDIVPSNVRRRMQQQAQKSRSATESVLYPESVPGVMRQPYHQEPSTCSLTESVERTRKGYSFIRRLADNMDASADGYRKQPAWSTKTPKSEGANVMSVWRKILLNDNVELLETLRDSLVWRGHRSDPAPNAEIDFTALNEKLGGQARNTSMNDFETSQNLTMEQMAELFSDCYENGTGVFSHVQANYQTVLKANDFRTVLRAMTGLFTFKTLSTEKVVILRPMYKSLLFLAIICGRFRVAEQLLRMRQFDLLPAAVLVVLILRRLRKEPSFPQQVISELQRFTDHVEAIAVDVLKLVSLKDNTPEKTICRNALCVPLRTFGDVSLIDLCAKANCTELLSLPCCQRVLDERWLGVLVHLPGWVRTPTRIMPPIGLLYLELKRKKERGQVLPLPSFKYDRRSSSISQDRRLSSSLNANTTLLSVAPNHTKFHTEYGSNDIRSLCSTPKVSFVDQTLTIYDKIAGRKLCRTSPRWYFFKGIFLSPSMKFCSFALFHLLFLVAFSFVCVYSLHYHFTAAEIVSLIYVAGFTAEEIRQIVIEYSRNNLRGYLKDGWNWIDMLAIGWTVAGLCVRMFVTKTFNSRFFEARDHVLYSARNLYMLGLNLFYMRTLYITSISQTIGPRLKMMADMLRKDLVPMVTVFAVFIVSYAVWFQGILYPNNYYRSGTGKGRGRLPPGELVKKLSRRAFYGIFEVSTVLDEDSCEQQDHCGDPVGRDTVTYFVLVIYVWIVNLILINLLIALFSNTVSRIDLKSNSLWLAGRYNMVKEYSERTFLPPPLNLLCVGYEILRCIYDRCTPFFARRFPRRNRKRGGSSGLVEQGKLSSDSSSDQNESNVSFGSANKRSAALRARVRSSRHQKSLLENSMDPESTHKHELDSLLKFVLLESFALQDRRHTLGMGLSESDLLNAPPENASTRLIQEYEESQLSTPVYSHIQQRMDKLEYKLEQTLRKLNSVMAESTPSVRRTPLPLRMPKYELGSNIPSMSKESVKIPTSKEIFAKLAAKRDRLTKAKPISSTHSPSPEIPSDASVYRSLSSTIFPSDSPPHSP